MFYKTIDNLEVAEHEKNLMGLLKSYKLKEEFYSLYNNEKIMYNIENVNIYTFTKSSSYTKSELINQSIDILKLLSSRRSYSKKTSLYTNALHYYGSGNIVLTKQNLMILTNLGHYKIRFENIVYFDNLDDTHVLIIEKQKKSYVFQLKQYQVPYFDILKSKQTSEVVEDQFVTLDNAHVLFSFSNYDNILFTCVSYEGKAVLTYIKSFKKLIEDLLLYFISDGIYLECDDVLISREKLVGKSKKVLRQQEFINGYYINKSNVMPKEVRLNLLLDLLTKSGIDTNKIVITYKN